MDASPQPRMPTAGRVDDAELGLSLARRLHISARRLPAERSSSMTLSTSAPLRSVTARPLAHISTTNSAAETLANDSRVPSPPPLPPADPLDASAVQPAADAPPLSASMRSFAVIICNECFYLEFPGCDIHGILYTERALEASDKGSATVSPAGGGGHPLPPKVHAKCPKCTAATNNVRPFREGCRRCKAETTVHMWCSTLSEIANAHEAFPLGAEEIAHTALTCESCQSVVFPRARESLTMRTADHAMTASNGKPLKVSNFQLSMPHVEGCARKGMPLQSVSVQLTKSELKFVLERIEQCPFTPRIQGGPQYRKRKQEVVTQQNHAHQIYLRLLSTVVKTYDPLSPNALDPLQKIVGLFDRMEPLTLFHEWSPPRVLSQTQHKPTRVEASSTLDDLHIADCVLSPDESMWRPTADGSPPPASESLQFHFSPPVAMAAIMLQWDMDFRPAKYAVVVSTEDGAVNTVAVVVDGRTHETVLFAQRTAVVCVRVTIYPDANNSIACGLKSVVFHEAGAEGLHTPAEVILHDLQQWLLRASLSPIETVRDTALIGLQKLTLACGSLCGLVQLATALVLNVAWDEATTPKGFDEQEWNRLDRLQLSVHDSTKTFVAQLATNVLKIMVTNDTPDAGENSLVERHVLEQMKRAIEKPGSAEPHEPTMQLPSPPPAATYLQVPSPKAVCASNEGEQSESPLYPYMTMAACQRAFTDSITRRSQVGMVVLMILSELSAWQMKRMQKAEEYAGKKEEELMQLEEPFSVEVRPQLFDLAHRLLCHVLSTWVAAPASPSSETVEETKREDADLCESEFDQEVESTLRVDLYNMLMHSFGELGAALGELGYLGSSEQNRRPTFTPDVMCVSILQIITSNIRRLVLSRVDPAEVGIATPTSLGQADLLSAPPALQPMVTTLEQLIALGTKRSDKFFPLSLKAAAAVEVGMEAFYPSAHQRTTLLRSRMGKGATLEVQVRWPVQERDQEDPRYERLILMLQFECIRMGFTHAIRGRWQFFMHLIVEVPALQDTEDVLHTHFASCIQQAGFSSWQVVAGAQEISINLQRHLHWNRVEKMSHDSGSGWIRVYPRDVARFDDVLTDVDLFLSDHDKRYAAKTAARP